MTVHPALPHRGGFALGHPRVQVRRRVLERPRRDLVREPHALDLLLGLDRAGAAQQRRRVGRVREGVEPGLRERRRLADHPIRRLRPEAELDRDPVVVGCELAGEIERAQAGRPRVALVVAVEEPHLGRPRSPLRIRLRRLQADQHRVALTREDDSVIALHAPEVRQVEDVVGGPDDERVQLLLAHQRAHSLELRVVPGPAHSFAPTWSRWPFGSTKVHILSPHGWSVGGSTSSAPASRSPAAAASTSSA